jgi:lysophospholipase L1-like esterase
MQLRNGIWLALFALCFLPQKLYGQTVSVADPNWFFSPYNWTIPGAGSPTSPTEIVANEPGAYFILRFSNSTQAVLNLDLLGTPPGGGTTSLVVQWRIDNTLHPKQTLNNVYPNLTLATGLDRSRQYTVQFWFVSADYGQNRWARTATLANGSLAPPQSLRITGMTLDAGATVLAPAGLRPKRILFYGDSITEGVGMLPAHDSTQTYAITCARLLDAEYGIVGNAGQAWTHNTALTTGVPLFGDAYTLHYDQTPRFPSGSAVPPPDYVIVNMGTNDWVYGVPQDDIGVTNTAFSWLQQMRTYFPSSQVFLVVPFGGFVEPALAAAYNRYVLSHPTDTKVAFINLASTARTGLTALGKGPTMQSFDGEHPNAATHLLLGYQLTAALQTALGRNDFDGDGKSDLILQNTSSNQIGAWFLNSAQVLNSALVSDVPDSNYQIVGSADFDGDGRPDYLFQNRQTGQLAIWFMNKTTHTGGVLLWQTPAAGWKVVGVGDFNGDGKPDILFQNETTNRIVVWYMDGTNMIGGALLDTIPATGYHVVGTADFNRDGQNDLLFQNDTTGALVIWYMNGVQYAGGEFVSATPAAGYRVEAIADFDGDGRPDVMLRNSNGNVALWHLDNANVFQAESLSLRLDPAFRIAGPR